MNRLLYILLAILLVAGSPLYGQEYPMLHYTLNDGLPSNTVYQVFRDSKGYLWLGTDKGIARYNGVKFEKFTTFSGLADNEVFMFFEDPYGRIWMATFNGELCYYQHDSFHTAQNTPFLKLPFKVPFIYSIIQEKDSSVTFNFYDRSLVVNISKNKVNIIPVKLNDENRNVLFARKKANGNYEVFYKSKGPAFRGIIVDLDTAGNIVKTADMEQSSGSRVFTNQGRMYLMDSSKIYTDEGKFVRTTIHKSLDSSGVYTYYENAADFFIGTKSGLFANDSISILKDQWVTSVTSDNAGNYWVGTHDNGVYCVTRNFHSSSVLKNVYPDITKYCQQVRGDVFFATMNNDLFRLHENSVSKLFDYKILQSGPYTPPTDAAYLIDNNYTYYSFYRKDIIVIRNVFSGVHNIGFYKSITYWNSSTKAVFSARGYIYVIGRHSILRSRPQDISKGRDIIETVVGFTDKGRIYVATQDADSSIWYSTVDAVYKLHDGKSVQQLQFKKETFKSFKFLGKYLAGVNHQNMLVICSDIEGNMRMDTMPQQNCVWDKIYNLDSEHLLISTDNLYMVLTCHADIKQPVSVVAIEDPFIPLHAEAICADSINCYFFHEGSITRIAIKSLLEKVEAPRLFFSVLKTLKSSYPIKDDMELSFEESKNVTIAFSALSAWGKGIVYQYSVSKDDDDHWHDLAGESINLFNPGYGDHIIRIRAKSISSSFSQPVQFRLHVDRPYWATWWFIVLCIVVWAILIGCFLRLRIIYILRKNKKAHETEIKFMKSEYKALNALMNPHFIFNTLNNVQSLFNENDKMAANAYLRVFADLIRQNMHNVSKEMITLQKEMDLVANYLLLEKLRFEDKLNYRITVDNNVDLTDILVPPLLIQPIVENSIKHGIMQLDSVEAMININVYEKNDTLYIEVKDNGKGLSSGQKNASSTHESIGLSNIKKRIEQLSIIQNKSIVFDIHDIKNDEGNVSGTIATITMPAS